jgi:hypothetical protein
VGEHLRMQNQAVEIIISEQPGIAPESVQINRIGTRDLLPDDLPHHTHIILDTARAYTRPPPFQEPKQYEFASRSSALQMVANSPKAPFINLDFAVQSGLSFTCLVHGSANYVLNRSAVWRLTPTAHGRLVGRPLQQK